jgi:hypothetical protein
LLLDSLHQFRDANPKSFRENLQHRQAYVLFPGFDFRNVSSINPELVRHFDLRQSFSLSQKAKSLAESDSNRARHAPIVGCRLWPTYRLLPTVHFAVMALGNQVSSGEGRFQRRLGFSSGPYGALYRLVSMLSWIVALASAGIAFALIPRWYVRVPTAALTFWISQALNGSTWAVIRGALFWTLEPGDDYRHARLHRLAIFILLIASAVGLAAFKYVPNWNDFYFNGHPSLVAVAGSLVMGLVALFWAFGIVAWILFSISVRLVGLSSDEQR